MSKQRGAPRKARDPERARAIDLARECFATIPDPRRNRGKRFALPDILLIALLAMLCGADTADDMDEWAELHLDWLEPWFNLKHGTPSQDTFLRVFELIRPNRFAEAVRQWLHAMTPQLTGQISIDGKSLRRSVDSGAQEPAVHRVSAWLREAGLVLGQVKTAEDSHETRAIPELLELLDLRGCVVSIDAAGCYPRIAAQVVEGGGDYLLAVQGNQPTLADDIEHLFAAAGDARRRSADELERPGLKSASSTDGGHGRIEERWGYVSRDLSWLSSGESWVGLSTVGMVLSRRTHSRSGKVEEATRYFISSDASLSATRLLELSRGHGSVENSLHWVLDVVFGEDSCRVRSRRAATNLGHLRRMALSMLKATELPVRRRKKKRMSLEARRRYCDPRLDYLQQVLSSPPS